MKILKNGNENFSKPKLVQFYHPQCPHCKSFVEKYEKLATDVQKNNKVDVIAVNCSKTDFSAFDISKIPTLRLYTESGKFVAYDQKIHGPMENESDILKFLQDNTK